MTILIIGVLAAGLPSLAPPFHPRIILPVGGAPGLFEALFFPLPDPVLRIFAPPPSLLLLATQDKLANFASGWAVVFVL